MPPWPASQRFNSAVLIAAMLINCWLGMQAVHEFGHALAARATGGEVTNVVLHPLAISRTDITGNKAPGAVVWAGPVVGVVLPVLLWFVAAVCRWSGSFLLRFFAGFCLVANGLYIGLGSFEAVGDCGVMMRNGAEMWQLWLFGLVTAPIGFVLWHRQGKHFGIGPNAERVSTVMAIGSAVLSLMLLAFGVWVGR